MSLARSPVGNDRAAVRMSSIVVIMSGTSDKNTEHPYAIVLAAARQGDASPLGVCFGQRELEMDKAMGGRRSSVRFFASRAS